jgi:plasmid stabilization system protein ParE
MPQQYKVIFTAKALDCLRGIFEYIEERSPQNAHAMAQEIIRAVDSLDFFPNRFKIHVHTRDPSRSVHSMPVPPFIVYYRVSDPLKAVRILEIRHGARRQPRRFP